MVNYIREGLKNLPGHWYQGDYEEYNNPDNKCGIGHVRQAFLDINDIQIGDDEWIGWWNKTGIETMSDVAFEQFPDRIKFPTFPGFNDHPDTTEADVIMVMEKAANKWDEDVDS